MTEEKPSKKEIKEVLARAEKIAKSQERIFDTPTLEKAKNTGQEEKKGSAAGSPDKVDILLEKVDGLTKRQSRLEEIYTKGAVTAVGTDTSKKKVIDQEDPARKTSEQLLAEAEAQQKAEAETQQKKDTGQQPQGQLTPEQYQALSAEKKVPILEAQLQAQQGQPNTGKQGLTGQTALYGLLEIAKTTSPIVIEAIRAKGNSGNPLNTFLAEMKVYQSIENTVLGGFFNFMKNLTPQQRQGTMTNIISSPPTATMTDLSGKPEIIK